MTAAEVAASRSIVLDADVLAEVLVHRSAGGLGEQAYAALKAMDLTVLDIPADAAAQLSSLRARTGRRMPDCCVLLAAARTGGAVLTFDEKLRGFAPELRRRPSLKLAVEMQTFTSDIVARLRSTYEASIGKNVRRSK